MADKRQLPPATDVIDEFDLPQAGAKRRTGFLGLGGEVRDDMHIRIRKGGIIEFYVMSPEGPDRVVPTDNELAYVKAILDERRRGEQPQTPTTREFPDGSLREHQPDGSWKILQNGAAPKPAGERSAPTSERYIVLADGTKAENPNYVPPKPADTITRPTGKHDTSEGQSTPRTETVSSTQANYDLNVAQEERQARRDVADEAIRADQALRADISNKLAQGQLDRQKAWDEYQKGADAIKMQMEARQQSITLRGQDVQAGVTQRGQDMNYESDLARAGTTLAGQLLQNWVAPSQIDQYNALRQNIGNVGTGRPQVPIPPLVGARQPYTPYLPIELARAARGAAPAPLQLPGAPGEVPLRLPG